MLKNTGRYGLTCALSGLLAITGGGAGCEQTVGDGSAGNLPSHARMQQSRSMTFANEPLNASDTVGAWLGRYRAFWPKRTDQELASLVTAVGKLFRASPIKLAKQDGLRDALVTPFAGENLVVDYKSKYAALRLHDPARLTDVRPKLDIGENSARVLAEQTVAALATSGVINAAHYDVGTWRTGHHKRQEFAGDDKSSITYTVEYRFSTLRRLNGIEVANNGIGIGVSPAGELSSVRLGGVEFDSEGVGGSEVPKATGDVVERTVPTDGVAKRFAEHSGIKGADRHVLWARKMYVMPEDTEEAVLEPMYVYRFAQISKASGVAISNGAEVLGFSLTDVNLPPSNFARN